MQSRKTRDVLVIGAGACGCTTAYFLALEGCSVALLDKGAVGREASWASAGMVGAESCPQRDPWFRSATDLSRRLYDRLDDELFDRTGRRIGYGGEGHLVIARDPDEVPVLRERIDTQTAGGIEARMLGAEEAREREPQLPPDVVAAGWMPGGRYLDARSFTATVAVAAAQAGARIHEGHPVGALIRDGDRIVGVRSGHESFHAAVVVNACGAWSGGIDTELTLPVYPMHGQIMAIAGRPGGLRHNVSRAGAIGYATPRSEGRVVVGATHDDWGFVKKRTPEGISFLGSIVQHLMPIMAESPVLDIWSGLRPTSPDSLPTIGPDHRASGGYLWAAGHAASGMMQMPATAQVVTDLVMGRAPALPIDQLSSARYVTDDHDTSGPRRSQFMSVENA